MVFSVLGMELGFHKCKPCIIETLPPQSWNQFFFFFAVLGFELRATNLLGMHSTTQAIPVPIFVLVILQIRSYGRF
jgi:hypothetical protein